MDQITLLSCLKGFGKEETEMTITIELEPSDMRKTGNPFVGRVVKRTTMQVKVNYDYEKEVKAMRKEEGVAGRFVAKERAWGVHVEGTPLIEHKGRYYLDFMVIDAVDPIYYLDGKEASPEDKQKIKSFMPDKKEGSGRQKVDEEIVVRTVKLESIVHILFANGTEMN